MARITPYSAVNMFHDVSVDADAWNSFPTPDVVDITAKAVGKRGITVKLAKDSGEALAAIQQLIPPGAEVMSGSSTTLVEIGFDEYISSAACSWRVLHQAITAENDAEKRLILRRKSVAADYFVSSVNAIARSGEIVACDQSGSRVGAWPFAAGHLILVAGINKIVPTLEAAFSRIRKYAFPLENARAMKAYGTPSMIGKCVVLAHEKQEGRITLVLVSETLGY